MQTRFGVASFVVSWMVFLAVYMSQIYPWPGEEWIAGGVLSWIGALLLARIRRWSHFGFVFRWQWLWLLLRRLPGKALVESAIVLKAVYNRDLAGEFIGLPFKIARQHRGEPATREALVITGISLTPNTVAIDADPARNVILVHQLVHTRQVPGSGNVMWPL